MNRNLKACSQSFCLPWAKSFYLEQCHQHSHLEEEGLWTWRGSSCCKECPSQAETWCSSKEREPPRSLLLKMFSYLSTFELWLYFQFHVLAETPENRERKRRKKISYHIAFVSMGHSGFPSMILNLAGGQAWARRASDLKLLQELASCSASAFLGAKSHLPHCNGSVHFHICTPS